MSLDVYLKSEPRLVKKRCWCCNVESESMEAETLYSSNITHNLNVMAQHAGLYKVLWRPEEIGLTTARQLIKPLEAGLALLQANQAHFEEYNSSNGWGTYRGLVDFVENYLDACRNYPDATVEVSR